MADIRSRSGLCAAVIVATFSTGAMAQVLLSVDLSVVDQVTISATGGLSAATASGLDGIGVYFENFYNGAGAGLFETLVAGDLTNAENASDLSPNLFRAGGGADAGLNIWSFSSDSTVTFTAGSLAFVGSATWDLDSAMYADMLAGNTSGDIYFAADDVSDLPGAVVIGQYSVIPTPGVLAVVGAGLGFGAMRRRR